MLEKWKILKNTDNSDNTLEKWKIFKKKTLKNTEKYWKILKKCYKMLKTNTNTELDDDEDPSHSAWYLQSSPPRLWTKTSSANWR